MSCGLGAVALMLIFIKTNISPSPEIATDLIDKTKNEIKEFKSMNAKIKEEIQNNDKKN